MSQRKKSADDLRQMMTQALLKDVGISERMSAPIVDSVMRCFAGQRTYFPATVRIYPTAAIEDSLRAGSTAEEVCRKFDISRRQLSRLFPGGLPGIRRHTSR